MSGIIVTTSSSDVALKDGRGAVTVSVTNRMSQLERIVLGAFPAGPDDATAGAHTWAAVERPLREIGPNVTEQYAVTFNAPEAKAGTYGVKFIAYAADKAPEEFNDQAQLVRVTATGSPAPAKPNPLLWIILAAILVVVIAVVVGFLLFSRAQPAAQQSPGPTPSQTPSPTETEKIKCQAGYAYRLVTPTDKVCVTPASAAQVIQDNAEVTQLKRKPNPPGGPYGINTCLQGFVWRDAYNGDQICVTVETRTKTSQENAEAALHSAP